MLQTRAVLSSLGERELRIRLSRLFNASTKAFPVVSPEIAFIASLPTRLYHIQESSRHLERRREESISGGISFGLYGPMGVNLSTQRRSLDSEWMLKGRRRAIPTVTTTSASRRGYSTMENEKPPEKSRGAAKGVEAGANKQQGQESTEERQQKYEAYGSLLWKRLTNMPSAIKRFVGLHGPMTLDKTLPFVNLMFVGVALGILVGTTSVVSLGIWVVNRNDRWQEMTARKVSEYLTYQTGISIEYEGMSASWKERRITLQNVKLERDPFVHPKGSVEHNVTAIKLDIQKLTVSVSLLWLLQGNGILKNVAADGVTGVVDQRHLDWTGWTPPKRVWARGDFFLDSFLLSNVNLSLFFPAPDRELKVQIHSIDCEKLRKQWLLRDLLCAKSAYGIFDGSLFSLTRISSHSSSSSSSNPLTSHPHYQQHIQSPYYDVQSNSSSKGGILSFFDKSSDDLADGEQITSVRSSLKIDGVKSDLISTSSSGPISWITEGTIDIDIDLDFRSEYWEEGWHYHMNTNTHNGFYSQHLLYEEEPLIMDIKLKLNNLRADIPISSDHMTLINRALVTPVVAYMNTNYTCIPLAFPVHVPREQFNGAWSPWDASLFEAISTGVAQQFLSLVKEQQSSTNLQRHLLLVIKSFHRGIYFLRQQVQGYYSLWYFNNDNHPEDLYAL